MRLVKPKVELLDITENALKKIEKAGRNCYKSEDKITGGSAENFVKMILKRGHEAVIEHAVASYKFICDRGVANEIVRHRLFSYAQESTRYCNYKGGVQYIIPCWMDLEEQEIILSKGMPEFKLDENIWIMDMIHSENCYKFLLDHKWSPQQARSVLPHALKTEIIVTGNFREWRHFFKLRCAKASHPQMREVALMALENISNQVPIIFDDYKEEFLS